MVDLTDRELRALRAALLEVATGTEVEEWEFPIRIGITKDEALKLVSRLSAQGTDD